MQKWQYEWTGVFTEEVEERTGEPGLFGGEKTQKRKRWFGWWDGRKLPCQDLLDQAGRDGWEMVGTAQESAMGGANAAGGGGSAFWYSPSHLLYFKRSAGGG